MLEEILKQINSSLTDLTKTQQELNQIIEKYFLKVTEEIVIAQPEQIQNTPSQVAPQPAIIPNQQTPIMPQIPVTQQSESFSKEQIARAMASAMDAGRQDVIMSILATFNAKSLMDIAPENYNRIATILREAGIQI